MTGETAKRVAGFLGLCNRAGRLSLGQEACVRAVRKRDAALVLLDEGCSGNTRKRFVDACGTYVTPLYSMPAGQIAKAVGKAGRMVAAVGPGDMAQKLLTLLLQEASIEERKNWNGDRGKMDCRNQNSNSELQSVINAGVQGGQ